MSGYYEPPPAFSSPYRDRLLSPKWDLIAERLGRPAPGILRELYAHPEQVLRSPVAPSLSTFLAWERRQSA